MDHGIYGGLNGKWEKERNERLSSRRKHWDNGLGAPVRSHMRRENNYSNNNTSLATHVAEIGFT